MSSENKRWGVTDHLQLKLVPLTRIERVASPLPRECSATELQGLQRGRFDGNLRLCTHPCLQIRKRRVRPSCMLLVKAPPNYVGDISIAENLERVNGIEPSS